MSRGIGVVVAALIVLAASAARGQVVAANGGERKPLVVGTKVVPPFAYKDPVTDEWTGISIDLWNRIAAKVGREYVWDEGANTNELLARVGTGELDVAIAAITVTPARAKLTDFSSSMFTSGLGIATLRGHHGMLGIVRRLFSVNFLRGLVSLSALLLIVGAVIWRLERRRNPQHFEPGIKGLGSGFWWSAVTMTTVGYGDKSPATLLGRLVGVVWMFSSVIMISTFTAAIATSLTTEQLESRVRGADDLRRVTVGAKQNEGPATFLRELGVQPRDYPSTRVGLEAIAAGEIAAFVHDIPVIQFELQSDATLAEKVTLLPNPLREEEYGIAVKRPVDLTRRNELRDEINTALLELKASGEYYRILNHYLGNH